MLPSGVERHRFDVTEYHKMLEVGLLTEDDRVELIGGEIVDMTPIGRRHMNCVNRFTRLLVPLVSDSGYIVSVQNPVRLGLRDEPEPDLAILRGEPQSDLPAPEETPLVIEVSDSSISYDREVKLPLYARSGLAEVWIANLQNRRIEVYTKPASDGYRAMRIFGAGERVGSREIEGIPVAVDEVLG